MVVTKDNEYLYTSCQGGSLKQFSIKDQVLIKDYGRIHFNIHSICITNEGQFLFTSDTKGVLKQFSVRLMKKIKDYGKIIKHQIFSITCG